jgi:hypothetical protein
MDLSDTSIVDPALESEEMTDRTQVVMEKNHRKANRVGIFPGT